MDLDKQDAKLAGVMGGAVTGLFLFFGCLAQAFLVPPTNGLIPNPVFVVYVLLAVLGPIISIACVWWVHEDRQRVTMRVTRCPTSFGLFYFAPGVKKWTRAIQKEVGPQEIPLHESMFFLRYPVVKKMLGFTYHKEMQMHVIDAANATKVVNEKGEITKMKVLDRTLNKTIGITEAQFRSMKNVRKVPRPTWANHLYYVDLEFEMYYKRGRKTISVWNYYLWTKEPYEAELLKMPYTIPGLRPFLFIDTSAAFVCLFSIGELLAEKDEDEYHNSIPIFYPVFDLNIGETIARKLAVPLEDAPLPTELVDTIVAAVPSDATSKKVKKSKHATEGTEEVPLKPPAIPQEELELPAEADLSAIGDEITRHKVAMILQTFQAVIGNNREQLETFQAGEGDAERKRQEVEADYFLAKAKITTLETENKTLFKENATLRTAMGANTTEQTKRGYSGKFLAALCFVFAIAGSAFTLMGLIAAGVHL